MKKYILIDAMNLSMRAKHVVHNQDVGTKIGMAFHIIFNSINKMYKSFSADHVVFCFEGRSWRKDHYPAYKENRKVLQAKKTPREQEDDQIFLEAVSQLRRYLEEKTNCTVLQHEQLEADDLISFWINYHPNDHHTIISSDSDFCQLIKSNVQIYDGVKDHLLTNTGVFDDKGNRVIDKKTKKELEVPDPEWLLFEKCVRGDTSDNIFSSYPGARVKGTKNKVGIREAFEDRKSKGYNYSNFMLQRWTDENNIEHLVKDRFALNELLIDLQKQPEEIKKKGIECIEQAIERPKVQNVGFSFLKFCTEWDLARISQYPDEYARILNRGYHG